MRLVIIPRGTYILDVESAQWGILDRSITVCICPLADDPMIASFVMLGREYTVFVNQCRMYKATKVA